MLKIADKLAGCLASLASTKNLQSIGLPVFPTGAIVVICTGKQSMISLDLVLPTGVVFGVAYHDMLWSCLVCVEKLTKLFPCAHLLTWGVSLPRIAPG